MNEATRPAKGRGTVFSTVALAAAMVACLVAPLASAAETPVAAGSKTTLTLNSGLVNKLKKAGVKLKAVAPATVGGKVVTLPLSTLSKLDVVTGQGELLHEGGIKFKKGKKSVSLTNLEIVTAKSELRAKVGSKEMKVASVSGLSSTRSGFGATVAVSSIKLTGAAAKQLNKKLGFSAKKKKAKKSSASASASKKKKKKRKAKAPFKGNQALGATSTLAEPKSVTIKPGGFANLLTNETTVKKFVNPPISEDPETGGHFVEILPIAPTELAPNANPFTPTLKFPLTGGSIAPNASAGTPQTTGGVNLRQDLSKLGGSGESVITLGDIWLDLTSKKATANVVVKSTVDPQLNLGNLERSSISVIDMTNATISSDPNSRTVTVTGATATLEETTATVLNSVFGIPLEKAGAPHPKFAAGDALGTFSFTATTE